MYEVPCKINITYTANCLYYTVHNFFFNPVNYWIHVEKISSRIISSVSRGQNYTVVYMSDTCGVPRKAVKLSMPVGSQAFGPKHRAAAILFRSNTPPTWLQPSLTCNK